MKTNWLLIAAVAGLLIAGIYVNENGLESGDILCPLAVPYSGSINCKEEGSETKNVGMNQVLIMHEGIEFPDSTNYNKARFIGLDNYVFNTQCGWSAIGWTMALKAKNYAQPDSAWATVPGYECSLLPLLTSLSSCQIIMKQALDLQANMDYKMEAKCLYPTSSENTNVNGAKMVISYTPEMYYYNFDSASDIPIQGTWGCKATNLTKAVLYGPGGNILFPTLQSQQPADNSQLNKISAAFSNIANIFGGKSSITPGSLLTNVPEDGEVNSNTYTVIYKWVSGDMYNVKQCVVDGKEIPVYCYYNGNAYRGYKVENILTQSSQECRSIPTTQISSTAATACCQANYCDSDLQCGSQITTSCIKDSNGKFYQIEPRTCNLATHTCRDSEKIEVKCCQSYCPADQTCDPAVGCKSGKSQCPKKSTEMWCSGSTDCPFIEQKCATGLTACPGTCQGECKVSCGADQCSSDSDCGQFNSATTRGVCVHEFLGGSHCESQKIDEQKTCMEQYGITKPLSLLDCYINQFLVSMFAAVQNGIKFVVAVLAFIALTMITDNSLKGVYKKKQAWKRPVFAIGMGLVGFIAIIQFI